MEEPNRRRLTFVLIFLLTRWAQLYAILVSVPTPWVEVLMRNGLVAIIIATSTLISIGLHRRSLDEGLWVGMFYTVLFSLLLYALSKISYIVSGVPSYIVLYALMETGMWFVCYVSAFFVSKRLFAVRS